MTSGEEFTVLAPIEETGVPVRLTFDPHAVRRFCERARPGLDYPHACLQLQGMVSCAPVSGQRPAWASQKASLWICLGDDVAFMVKPSTDHPEELEATTCLTRDGARSRR
jgi:hypothetical protein